LLGIALKNGKLNCTATGRNRYDGIIVNPNGNLGGVAADIGGKKGSVILKGD
jgi:hypothetical protein